ncbi:unnamed protein product [Boreogadus saida]
MLSTSTFSRYNLPSQKKSHVLLRAKTTSRCLFTADGEAFVWGGRGTRMKEVFCLCRRCLACSDCRCVLRAVIPPPPPVSPPGQEPRSGPRRRDSRLMDGSFWKEYTVSVIDGTSNNINLRNALEPTRRPYRTARKFFPHFFSVSKRLHFNLLLSLLLKLIRYPPVALISDTPRPSTATGVGD